MTLQSVEYLLQMHTKGRISAIDIDKALSTLNTPEKKSSKNEEYVRKGEKIEKFMRRKEKEFEERMQKRKKEFNERMEKEKQLKKRTNETTNIVEIKTKRVEQKQLQYRNTLHLTDRPLCNYLKTYTKFQ